MVSRILKGTSPSAIPVEQPTRFELVVNATTTKYLRLMILPDDFRNIPEDAPYYAVRTSVPGTSESAEARLKASIPTTARVANGSITPTVSYAGEPQFSPVEGTNLAYAANTNDTVLKVGDAYFLLQDGVWFVGQSPAGPWQLAREVPEEISQSRRPRRCIT